MKMSFHRDRQRWWRMGKFLELFKRTAGIQKYGLKRWTSQVPPWRNSNNCASFTITTSLSAWKCSTTIFKKKKKKRFSILIPWFKSVESNWKLVCLYSEGTCAHNFPHSQQQFIPHQYLLILVGFKALRNSLTEVRMTDPGLEMAPYVPVKTWFM